MFLISSSANPMSWEIFLLKSSYNYSQPTRLQDSLKEYLLIEYGWISLFLDPCP